MEDIVPLINICKEESLEHIKEKLNTEGNLNERDKRGRTALHLSAERGRSDVMQTLIEHGADTMAKDNQGNTPLHYCGHVETIQCLLNSGVFVNERNNHGDTALVLLRRRGVEKEAISLLEPYEEDEAIGIGGNSQQILLNQPSRPSVVYQPHGNSIKNVWFDFCLDLGPEKLVIVLLVILLLSLYIAYVATDFARVYDTRIPITDEMLHTEL